MQLSDERLQELKVLLEKKHGREFSSEEVEEAGRQLVGFAEIMYEGWREEQRRLSKLKENPKGFVLEGIGYTCFICHNNTQKDENWYDKWGIKCTICQEAIDRKEIPPSLAKHRDSWYTKYDLERAFNLKGKVLNSWIKQGLLKVRTVSNRGKGVHAQLFLIKDNKDMLPPKKMVEGHSVKEDRGDGKDWYSVHPWYHFVDPYEHLKGYKIMDYLKFTTGEKEE